MPQTQFPPPTWEQFTWVAARPSGSGAGAAKPPNARPSPGLGSEAASTEPQPVREEEALDSPPASGFPLFSPLRQIPCTRRDRDRDRGRAVVPKGDEQQHRVQLADSTLSRKPLFTPFSINISWRGLCSSHSPASVASYCLLSPSSPGVLVNVL